MGSRVLVVLLLLWGWGPGGARGRCRCGGLPCVTGVRTSSSDASGAWCFAVASLLASCTAGAGLVASQTLASLHNDRAW